MLPTISEVVLIFEFSPDSRQNITNPCLLDIDDFPFVVQVGIAVYLATDPKLVQMIVLPAHHHLQNPVELRQRGVFPNLKLPRNRRGDTTQDYLELI